MTGFISDIRHEIGHLDFSGLLFVEVISRQYRCLVLEFEGFLSLSFEPTHPSNDSNQRQKMTYIVPTIIDVCAMSDDIRTGRINAPPAGRERFCSVRRSG